MSIWSFMMHQPISTRWHLIVFTCYLLWIVMYTVSICVWVCCARACVCVCACCALCVCVCVLCVFCVCVCCALCVCTCVLCVLCVCCVCVHACVCVCVCVCACVLYRCFCDLATRQQCYILLCILASAWIHRTRTKIHWINRWTCVCAVQSSKSKWNAADLSASNSLNTPLPRGLIKVRIMHNYIEIMKIKSCFQFCFSSNIYT